MKERKKERKKEKKKERKKERMKERKKERKKMVRAKSGMKLVPGLLKFNISTRLSLSA